MDDRLIGAQATAVRALCEQPWPADTLKALQRSAERASLLPKETKWHRKARAYMEIFTLLASAADDPALARVLGAGANTVHRLMITAGPSASAISANSCRRLVGCLSARDADGAAYEMERYLRILSFLGRLTATSFRNAPAWPGSPPP